ncbi:ABC transporter transmembrane domain-containing protein [Brevibacterium sp. JSBI002]|uniref:ABC transporter transmembrane domain-containing protein n=1 Tax=Brevibacterium sp. JSBI002 TaxID=2886045 RepID=UPI00222EA24F|nr:ABC transporter ATP-binding protein [Brevibacterium sp. JSBI002]UZD62854.1 ABC transporter ATP-binding protein/permease [Brevibacterium sp. JSBI002]
MPKTPETGAQILRRAARRRIRPLLGGAGALSVWQVCEALVPVAIGFIVDRAIIPLSIPALVISIIGLGLLFTVLSLGYRFGARLCNSAREHEAHALRVEITHAALTAPSLPTDRTSGEVLSIASADADTAAASFQQAGRGIASVLGMITAAVFLLIADPVTGLVVLIAVPIGLIVVALPGRSVSARATAQLEAVASAGRSASDLMHGLRVIKAMGGEPWAVRRYRATSDAAADAGIATGERTGRLAGLGALVMSAVLAIVLIVAGLRLIDGQMSVGALIGILGMTAFLTEPMRALADIVGLFAQSHGAAERIARLLTSLDAAASTDTTDALAEAAPTTRDAADIRPRVTTTESGITITGWPSTAESRALTTAGGALTCIVSDDAEDAAVLLAELTSHARNLGPARMLVAPHDVDLFEGTIGSNITMVVADDSADTDDRTDVVEHPPISAEVLTASGVDELLDLVDGGLGYRIQELGGNLSGGQRQRVALARALNADPQILVLAEPTTAVDAVTEARIAHGLSRLRRRSREQATIILTSSPAFLAAADTVIYRPTSGPLLLGRHADLLETDTDSAEAYRDALTR